MTQTRRDEAEETRWRAVGAPGAQLVVLSGPSGVGKDTIIEALRERPRCARLDQRP